MKLKRNQLALIRHLAQFKTLDYQSCLRLLDTGNSGDKTALSYEFRPLTKYKYISKHKDGVVTLLAKGKALFPNITPLVNFGGTNHERINAISRTAALLAAANIETVASADLSAEACFVPSTCWRKIRQGILSTTRFAGILFVDKHRLAVYDIGDGKTDWQLRAERSLFYRHYGEEFLTHATGMLMICDGDERDEIAKRIVRETMWRRKQLIEYESYDERTRPVKYSRSPIRIAWYYEHVYLTTPNTLAETLEKINIEERYIDMLCGDNPTCHEHKLGDFEIYPRRFFVNITADLLKYVYLFSEIKSSSKIKFSIVLSKEDFTFLEMYPDIVRTEGFEIYEYRHSENGFRD